MTRVTLDEVVKVFFAILLISLVFASFLYLWVTGDDIENLPKDSLDRFLSLFFYSFTSFTTIGFGEYGRVQVKSRRLQIVTVLYILLAISGAASFFFNF